MRLVIKVGTGIIVEKKGVNKKVIGYVIKDIAKAIKEGHKVILVSSGAIGTGISCLPFSDSHKKKVAAAVGQPLLMKEYILKAKKNKLLVGQVLLLSDDLTNSERFKNFIENIEAMLSHKVLPIINENDFIKTEDLSLGDNDLLSAKIAKGIKADKLILLTNQKGVYTCNPDSNKNAKLIRNINEIEHDTKNICSIGKSEFGLGGMTSKIESAKYANDFGIETYIGDGREKGIIYSIINKKGDKNFSGTKFTPKK